VIFNLFWFFFINSTRFLIEINLPLSEDYLFQTSSFDYRLSGSNSSQDKGYILVLLNSFGGYSLGKTLRLLFFLMALNFYKPFEVFNLFRQYFLSYLLWFVEPVLSFFFLLSIVCLTN
jgi:hypothetical protein